MENKLKIIIVVGAFPKISETFIVRKAIFLTRAGHEVLILSRREENLNLLNAFGDVASKLNIEFLIPESGPFQGKELKRIFFQILKYISTNPIISLNWYLKIRKSNPKTTWRFFLKYLIFINKRDYDIVHFEFLNLSTSYKLLPEFLSSKFIASCRGTDLHTLPIKPSTFKSLLEETILKYNGIHCVSSEMKHFFLEQFPQFNSELVFVNRPAIDPVLFTSIFSISKSENPIPIILSIGRLEWIKGFDYLLAAYKILKDKNYSFQAYILGEGALYNELNFSIMDLGLEKHVKLEGKVSPDMIPVWLQKTDIFVLSSHNEGISNSVLEAMASGIPVVSTSVGGMAEVIEDGVNGLLVPFRNPAALADKIEYLMNNKRYRTELGMSARQSILESMNLENQAKIFEDNYRIISGR